MSSIYDGKGEVAGPLQPFSTSLRYTKLLGSRDMWRLRGVAVFYFIAIGLFIEYLCWPGHYPVLRHGASGSEPLGGRFHMAPASAVVAGSAFVVVCLAVWAVWFVHRWTATRQVPSILDLQRSLHLFIAGLAAGGVLIALDASTVPALAMEVCYNLASLTGLVLIIGLQVVGLLQTSSVLLYTSRAVDPVPMQYPSGLRVAMLTTIVPAKEPWEIARKMLLAAKQFRLDGGTVDVWILDEGNDPFIKAECEQLGINHYSRAGIDKYQTVEVRQRNRGLLFWHRKLQNMPFRTKTKHGNHNSWIQEVLILPGMHEEVQHCVENGLPIPPHCFRYDLVGQADPDHCALEGGEFFHRNAGYFNDPDVGFIVSPQVYGNHENWIARGAAQLTYVFHGVIQRGCNGLGAPILIGTNHIFRPAAWLQIGGYQDCIIEDHLTAMKLPAEKNPLTGGRWKGAYSPDITTAGEGPTSFSDFFSQQARWAYGIFEIVTRFTPKTLRHLSMPQRFSFMALQFFYPSVCLTWAMGNALSALYLLFGVTSARMNPVIWFSLFVSSLLLGLSLTFWLRKFNLVDFEKKGLGLTGMALNLFTTPVYLAAGWQQLRGKNLNYVVTAKGKMASGDTWRTFHIQLKWIAFAVSCMTVGILTGHHYLSLYVWMTLTIVYCLLPIYVWKREARKTVGQLHEQLDQDGDSLAAAELVLAGEQVALSELMEVQPEPERHVGHHRAEAYRLRQLEND